MRPFGPSTAIFLAACATAEPPVADDVLVEMFVMSQCPYGVEVEAAIAPVAEKLGDRLDVKLHYIGNGTAGALTSMHGPDEVTGDLAQVCADAQDHERTLAFVQCQNEDPRRVATNWRECGERLGLDVARLEACTNGPEGQALLAASFAEADARGATGSPTIFVDGAPYEGGRRPNDFLRAICAGYDSPPAACADLPVPPPVDAIFLSDARCAPCDLRPLEPRLRSDLGGLRVRYVDYGSEEGQALWAEIRADDPTVRHLPIALLSTDAQKDADGWAVIGPYTRPLAGRLELRLDGTWDPAAEICDNRGDDDGDGLADCADDACAPTLACRPPIPGKLDLFVMSRCPYGAKAMIATDVVLDHLGRDLDLEVHFIGHEEKGALASMHGQAEVDDDLREICAQRHYPDDNQFVRFLACHSRDYRSADWQRCAREAGMDPAVIEACFAGEGPALLRASFAYSASLGIGSSPTFLVDNTRAFNATDPGRLHREYCASNPGRKGCDTPIAADVPAEAPAEACGN